MIEEKLEEAEDVQVYLPFGDLHLDFVEMNMVLRCVQI